MKALGKTPQKILLVSTTFRAFKKFWESFGPQPGNNNQVTEICRSMSMALKWGMAVLLPPEGSHSTATKQPLAEKDSL